MEEHIWLRALAPNLEKKTTEYFLEKAAPPGNQGYRRLVDSVLGVVIQSCRDDDVEKALADQLYRQRLYMEFNI